MFPSHDICTGASSGTGGFQNSIAFGTNAVNTASNQLLLPNSIATIHAVLNSGVNGSVLTNDGSGNASWQQSYTVGAATINRDGIATVFNIPHGLGQDPTAIFITFEDGTDTNLLQSTRTHDGTNIIITCTSPPTGGNTVVNWQAFK